MHGLTSLAKKDNPIDIISDVSVVLFVCVFFCPQYKINRSSTSFIIFLLYFAVGAGYALVSVIIIGCGTHSWP